MKTRILQILRANNNILSGEAISDQLGVSRVAVWKHINKLKALGYDIQAFGNGYRMVSAPDALFAWEFPGRSENIHYFSETTSTMDVAWELGRKGCPDFTTVIADRQTKGRGRMARAWISEDGGIYFSMILRPQMPATLSFQVNFAASLTLARVLQAQYGVNAKVKWPNDILIDDAKLCGMLSELETRADMVSFINLGIGINVNNRPDPKEQKAVSLKDVLQKEVSRRDLLAAFLDAFEPVVGQLPDDQVITKWKQYTGTLQKQVRITTLKETYHGFAEDVDDSGALLLRMADGTQKKVIYGDCFYHKNSEA